MLTWAAAAAIPLIIHLLARRKQIHITWAAMRLLQQVVDQESQRIRFEQLLLLLLRMAILLVLALAMARPFWSSAATETVIGSPVPKLWIIGIDLSYSMQYREQDTTRLQLAKHQAAEFLDAGSPGDRYMLLAFGEISRAVIREPTFDRQKVLAEIHKLKTLDTGADVLGGIQFMQSVVAETQHNNDLPDAVNVLILSDMGQDSWEPVLSEKTGLEWLAQNANCHFVSLAEPDPQNLAIVSLDTNRNRPLVNQDTEVSVRIENYGFTDVDRLPVQLSIDAQTIETQFIPIAKNSSRTVTFSIRPKSGGTPVVTAMIPEDRLLVDNVRSRIIEVRDQNRILFVDEQENETRLVRLSLTPRSTTGSAAESRDFPAPSRDSESGGILTVSLIDLVAMDLDEWDAVVLHDIRFIDASLIRQLVRYVRGGGNLLISFGPNTQSALWNQLLENDNLLGFKFAHPSDYEVSAIDPLEYASPVVLPFKGFPDAGLITTPVFRHWRIQELDESLVRDLGLTDSSPLIVRQPLGAGWVASILSAPDSGFSTIPQDDESWNAMATWPSFVPLMRQLLQTLLNSKMEPFNLQTGQILQGGSEFSVPASVAIVLPDGVENSILTEPVGENQYGWFFGKTQMQGIYLARYSNGRVQPYAVNLDPVQSRLKSISKQELPLSHVPKEAQSSSPAAGAIPTSPALSRLALLLLLVLLAAESLAALYIGRRIG